MSFDESVPPMTDADFQGFGGYTETVETPEQALDRMTADQVLRLKAQQAAKDLVAKDEAGRVPLRLGRRHISEVAHQATQELEVRHEYGITGFSTGIPTLDAELRSTLQPGRVIGIAADTKSGKTTLGGQLVVSFACQNLPVLLGSFEDQQTDTVYRYLANLTSGDVGVIRDGFRDRDGRKMPIPENFDAGVDKLSALGIELMVQSGTVEQIAFEAEDWVKTYRRAGQDFGVLVLDQLSHFIPSNRAIFMQRFPGYPPPPASGSQRDMMVWQVQMLTRVAKKLNICIVVMMQMTLSSKPHDKPSHHDLREAKAAAFELDALLIPWRPSKVRNENRALGEPEFLDNTDQRTWLLCPIGRQVTAFELEVTWDGPGQRFLDLGTARTAAWTAPTPPSERAIEGMKALAALRQRWSTSSDSIHDEANGALTEPRELPAARPRLSTPGAKWPARFEPTPPPPAAAPAPYQGVGFGGGAFGGF